VFFKIVITTVAIRTIDSTRETIPPIKLAI